MDIGNTELTEATRAPLAEIPAQAVTDIIKRIVDTDDVKQGIDVAAFSSAM